MEGGGAGGGLEESLALLSESDLVRGGGREEREGEGGGEREGEGESNDERKEGGRRNGKGESWREGGSRTEAEGRSDGDSRALLKEFPTSYSPTLTGRQQAAISS